MKNSIVTKIKAHAVSFLVLFRRIPPRITPRQCFRIGKSFSLHALSYLAWLSLCTYICTHNSSVATLMFLDTRYYRLTIPLISFGSRYDTPRPCQKHETYRRYPSYLKELCLGARLWGGRSQITREVELVLSCRNGKTEKGLHGSYGPAPPIVGKWTIVSCHLTLQRHVIASRKICLYVSVTNVWRNL